MMTFSIDTSPIQDKCKWLVDTINQKFPHDSAAKLTQALKNHVMNRYPGSTHWSPSNIYQEGDTVVVDIPGASRAYHDIDIYPVDASWLCFMIGDAFIKTKHVHQNQDETLLPQMDEIAEIGESVIATYL